MAFSTAYRQARRAGRQVGGMMQSNAEELAAQMAAETGLYMDLLERAIRENAELLVQQCEMFSGTQYYSTAELAAMGHPYATREPNPPMPPFLINKQSGALNEAWNMNTQRTVDAVMAVIWNAAPYSGYMEGPPYTSLMIRRPIVDVALDVTRRQRAQNINNAGNDIL